MWCANADKVIGNKPVMQRYGGCSDRNNSASLLKKITGLVKMATKCYPKTCMDEVEFSELGDDKTLTTSIDGQNITAHAWGDKVRKCFLSTHFTAIPGKTFKQMLMEGNA